MSKKGLRRQVIQMPRPALPGPPAPPEPVTLDPEAFRRCMKVSQSLAAFRSVAEQALNTAKAADQAYRIASDVQSWVLEKAGLDPTEVWNLNDETFTATVVPKQP